MCTEGNEKKESLLYDEFVKNAKTTGDPGFRLEFIPMKIETGMTKTGPIGLFTTPSYIPKRKRGSNECI
jgi:hypothetical protein